ncbi:sensor histidine kinase [Nonlabens ponticola]|uniref:Histidine kinase n=1 Tax=Nonlabens ponticola TaxID=2496866 RepID=A0A3S9MX49_9FLAO|nr:histidine kinase [Nonlabens ponticola]AZQ43718.1 histidine kinase [Nonlabens ponticola]
MRWLSLLLLLLVCSLTSAQQFPSTHYTDRDILPNNTVRNLFQAADGALWIGTDNGLVRKFNDRVDTYFKEDGLAQNNVWAIAQDPSGRLWIGSYGNGLSVFEDGKLRVFAGNSNLPDQEVTRLMVHDQSLYIGTSNGIAVVDLADVASVKSIKPNPKLDEPFIVQDFMVINDAVYVLSYSNGIYKIDTSEEQLQLEQVWNEKYLYSAHVANDTIYFSGKEYFKKVAATKFSNLESLRRLKPQGQSIIWDYEQAGDQLFAAAWGIYANDGGIYVLENDGMRQRNADFGIASTQVTSLAYDQDLKLLYAGTLDDGFYEIRLDENVLFFPNDHEQVIDFASVDDITAALYNDGLQIGSTEIPAELFKQKQVEYVAQHPNDLPRYEDYFYELDYETRAEDIVFYSVKSQKDSFWVNASIGNYQFDKSGKLINYMPVHALEIGFTASGQLLEPNFFHGTRIYDSVAPMNYKYFDETATEQNPRFVVGVMRKGEKTYLTSIFDGLYVYMNGKFNSYEANDIWQEKRLRFVTDFGADQIAVSNEDGDVFILNDDPENFTATKINRNNAHGSTITFLTSYKNTLIIGTPKGVVLHHDGREIFLDGEQGLNGKIHNGFVKGDTLLLGSDNGSYQLKLADILNQENRIDRIAVKSIRVNGNTRSWNPDQTLQLSSNENALEIQLGVEKHPYPNKLTYHYSFNRASGWIPMEDATLSLPSMDSGKYRLFVQVLDSSTGMTVNQEVLAFRIATPFYKSIWFIALCFLLVMGLMLVYFRLKRKRAKQKAAQQEAATKRIEEVKMEALLSQMNPHFVFNSLNSVQYFISNDENEKAMRYLSIFSDLMRANLNNTTKPFLRLEEEIDYLKKYIALENARFSDRVRVTFVVDPKLSVTDTMIPTMLLQPFVENAFVHAFPDRIQSPRLDISFETVNHEDTDFQTIANPKADANYYRCIIKDNGIGSASLTKNKRHTSKGTQLVEERLSFLGYDQQTALRVNYTATGTTVILILER